MLSLLKGGSPVEDGVVGGAAREAEAALVRLPAADHAGVPGEGREVDAVA